uniref:Uncharacterized protein n=1 Tax=Aegilops tauschii TaxID=37682 RepID=M8CSV8_AEGTA
MEAGAPNLRGRLQVTFCAVAPPLVSYFCVHASHMDHTEFPVEPRILATETDGGLVLLCVATADPDHPIQQLSPENCQYFVYDALARKLHQLPQPGFQHRLSELSLAIMRKPNKSSKNTSKHNTTFPSKTLTMGGSNGTVAWVDLWRNIVFCDVLAERPKLSYLNLPSEPGEEDINPRSVRDIAVFGNTIKYVAMLFHPVDTSSSKVPSLRWVATAWSITKARRHRSWPKKWHMERELDSTHIKVDAAGTVATFPTLSSLCVGLPTLSLQNDAIVYFLAKIDFSPRQHTAWVLAVDMKNETAEQVVEFPAERTYYVAKGYDASRFSAYLQPAPGTQQMPNDQGCR